MNLGRWCISLSLEPPIGFWGLKERNRMLRAPLGISGAKRWSLWRVPGGSSFSLLLKKAPCHIREVEATHSLSSIYARGSKKKNTKKKLNISLCRVGAGSTWSGKRFRAKASNYLHLTALGKSYSASGRDHRENTLFRISEKSMKKWKGKADFTVERLGHEKGKKKSMLENRLLWRRKW